MLCTEYLLVVGTNALPQNRSVLRLIEFWDGFGITTKSVVQSVPVSATAAVPARNRWNFEDTLITI
jgi:hypothetical protein